MSTQRLSHFAINADDVPASKAFYEAVFDWTFTPWGPPGFFRITTGSGEDPGVRGVLQQRRRLLADRDTFGLECTFAVNDLQDAAERIRAAGGHIRMEPVAIPGVGQLLAFEDPSGNVLLAMEYDPDAE